MSQETTPLPDRIDELKRLRDEMADDWVDEDGRPSDIKFTNATFAILPDILARLEELEAENAKLRGLLLRARDIVWKRGNNGASAMLTAEIDAAMEGKADG